MKYTFDGGAAAANEAGDAAPRRGSVHHAVRLPRPQPGGPHEAGVRLCRFPLRPAVDSRVGVSSRSARVGSWRGAATQGPSGGSPRIPTASLQGPHGGLAGLEKAFPGWETRFACQDMKVGAVRSASFRRDIAGHARDFVAARHGRKRPGPPGPSVYSVYTLYDIHRDRQSSSSRSSPRPRPQRRSTRRRPRSGQTEPSGGPRGPTGPPTAQTRPTGRPGMGQTRRPMGDRSVNVGLSAALAPSKPLGGSSSSTFSSSTLSSSSPGPAAHHRPNPGLRIDAIAYSAPGGLGRKGHQVGWPCRVPVPASC